MVLGALRKAEKAMTTGEVVQAIVDELGYGLEAAKGMSGRVRANLLYLSKVRGLVVKEGERAGARWGLAEK